MNAEEQQQEIEILESIYPDELEKITDTKFNIHFALETRPKQFIVLEVQYPEDYPEVVPNLDIELDDSGYLEIEDEEEVVDEIDGWAASEVLTKEDLKELKTPLEENAEENVGMPSIFTIASLLKDLAEEKFAAKIAYKEKQREREILAQEEKDNEKFRGTPVTPESFAEWRKKFRQEFKLDQTDKVDSQKLTGREIFEQGLNKDADEEDEELVGETANLDV